MNKVQVPGERFASASFGDIIARHRCIVNDEQSGGARGGGVMVWRRERESGDWMPFGLSLLLTDLQFEIGGCDLLCSSGYLKFEVF